MRRSVSALALLAALPALSQEAAAPRFALFAPMQLIQNSVRGKQLFAELEVKGRELETRIKAKADELQRMDQQLKSPGLSEEGRAKIQRDLQDGELSIKRLQEDSQKEFAAVQQRVYGTFSREVEPIVEALAQEWKLQVVLQYTEQTANLFAYTDKAWALTFTNEVAKRYDAKYPSVGSTPAPAAAPKPAAKAPAPAPKKGN